MRQVETPGPEKSPGLFEYCSGVFTCQNVQQLHTRDHDYIPTR